MLLSPSFALPSTLPSPGNGHTNVQTLVMASVDASLQSVGLWYRPHHLILLFWVICP